jgi:hypothetical protein
MNLFIAEAANPRIAASVRTWLRAIEAKSAWVHCNQSFEFAKIN